MSRAWMLLLPIALGSCQKQSAIAEREAAIVERSGTPKAICEAKRKVAAAYLAEQNESQYALYNGAAESYCLNARLTEQNRISGLPDDTLTGVH